MHSVIMMQINVLLVVMEFLLERSCSPEDAPLLIAIAPLLLLLPMGPVRLANICTLAVFCAGRGERGTMAAACCICRLYVDPSLTLLLLPQRNRTEK